MLESFKYKNHVNEVIEFGKDGIFVNMNDLHDYSWDFTKNNNKIATFSKKIESRKLPVIIFCDTEEEGIRKRNALFEVVERDVLAGQHGNIVLGDYYLKCFVTESKKKNYLAHKHYMETTLTISTDFPKWVKESTVTFRTNSSAGEAGTNLDYPHDFPFDYTTEMTNKKLNNTSFVDSNFKLVIFGACSNPSVMIAGHTYRVFREVQEGEYLTIDSLSKTITLTQLDGTNVNCFNERDRDSYIFKEIPTGNNVVTWTGNFGFDVILLEERSEPKWI